MCETSYFVIPVPVPVPAPVPGSGGININEKSGMDLVFVFDGSSSIGKGDFELGLRFAQGLVKMIGAHRRP